MPRAAIYVRLSREDLAGEDATAEKFALRVAMCHQLASNHGLAVAESDVFVERESGGKLANRPLLLKILDLCERGEISHLITPAYDRLSRGDARDNADIEDALLAGRVTLITNDGATLYDDSYEDKYAPLQGLKAIFARMERRAYSNRIKAANAQRTAQGAKSQGQAPYGYKWIKPVYDGKKLVERGRYEVVPSEYAIVCEIFRRIREEGIWLIARDLNDRNEPSPGSLRFAQHASGVWRITAVYNIVTHPFYAGYPAHRHAVNRKGEIRDLPREEWILSDEEQSYPHPVTLAEFEQIGRTLKARKQKGTKKAKSEAILTGILHCHRGRAMRNAGRTYRCGCPLSFELHPNTSFSTRAAHAIARSLAEAAFAALPADALRYAPAPEEAPQADASPLLRDLNAKKREITQLQSVAPTLQRALGEEVYRQSLSKLEAEKAALEAQLNALQAVAQESAPPETVLIVEAVRRHGFNAVWEEMTIAERHAVLQGLFRAITLIEPTKTARPRAVHVEPREWLAEHFPAHDRDVPLRGSLD